MTQHLLTQFFITLCSICEYYTGNILYRIISEHMSYFQQLQERIKIRFITALKMHLCFTMLQRRRSVLSLGEAHSVFFRFPAEDRRSKPKSDEAQASEPHRLRRPCHVAHHSQENRCKKKILSDCVKTIRSLMQFWGNIVRKSNDIISGSVMPQSARILFLEFSTENWALISK